jgi:nicotinate-nucleotide pyrophosphorylase (carboxylating)
MVGGGHPHRYGLYDAVLIKDNHIRVASSITEAVARVRDAMRQGVIKRGPIEVETQTLSEVREAVRAGVDIIMLDNFTPEMVKRARQLIPRSIMVEVSGGITESNIMKYAPYADIISMGALTSSYRSVDISLEIERVIGRSRMSSQSL